MTVEVQKVKGAGCVLEAETWGLQITDFHILARPTLRCLTGLSAISFSIAVLNTRTINGYVGRCCRRTILNGGEGAFLLVDISLPQLLERLVNFTPTSF